MNFHLCSSLPKKSNYNLFSKYPLTYHQYLREISANINNNVGLFATHSFADSTFNERQLSELVQCAVGSHKEFFIFVCSLVFTPLIGYQVSLVDSLAIRRLSHGRRYFR
jgi:hypothetical protein